VWWSSWLFVFLTFFLRDYLSSQINVDDDSSGRNTMALPTQGWLLLAILLGASMVLLMPVAAAAEQGSSPELVTGTLTKVTSPVA
jgi:predicted permease